MYLRLINVKAIERQRDSYILVINNRYEKMGESLYRINKDALEIIRNLNGTKTFDDLVDMMISCHLEKKEQAKYKLNNFLNELEKNPGISVEYLKNCKSLEEIDKEKDELAENLSGSDSERIIIIRNSICHIYIVRQYDERRKDIWITKKEKIFIRSKKLWNIIPQKIF